MRTERPTCRECACSKVCEYFYFENERNLDERCALENWEKYFVPKQEWISVDERLPEKVQHVLCLYPQKDYGSKVVVDYAETADGFFAEQYLFGRPSHWMPLPEPPKMKGEK